MADDERAQLVLMGCDRAGEQHAGRQWQHETTKHENSSTNARLTGVSRAE